MINSKITRQITGIFKYANKMSGYSLVRIISIFGISILMYFPFHVVLLSSSLSKISSYQEETLDFSGKRVTSFYLVSLCFSHITFYIFQMLDLDVLCHYDFTGQTYIRWRFLYRDGLLVPFCQNRKVVSTTNKKSNTFYIWLLYFFYVLKFWKFR